MTAAGGNLAETPLNQARSMLLAARKVDPHVMSSSPSELMNAILGPLFLRIPVAVLVGFAVSRLVGWAGVPRVVQGTVFWGLALSLPIIVLVFFLVLALWRLRGFTPRERLLGEPGDRRLLIITVIGYALSSAVGMLGSVLAPAAFPV